MKDHPDINDTLQAEGVEGVRARHDRARKFNREAAGDTKRKALPFRRHREGNAPNLKWTVKNLIPQQGTGLLAGQFATLKTFLAVDLGGALAFADTYLGFRIKRNGATLIFANEGTTNLEARIDALSLAKFDDRPMPIYVCTAPVRLLDPASVEEVIATARDVSIAVENDRHMELVLIMFDTVSGAAGYEKAGDENDPTVGHKLIAAMRSISETTGSFVLGIDHLGKTPEAGVRGASSKEGAADVVLAAIGGKQLNGKVADLRLAVRKLRDGGASGAEFPYRMQIVDLPPDEEGDPQTSVVVLFEDPKQAPTAKEEKEPGAAFATLRRVMMGIIATDGQDIKPYADGPIVRAVPVDVIRPEFYAEYPTAESGTARADKCRSALRRALKNSRVHIREIDGQEWVWFVNDGR